MKANKAPEKIYVQLPSRNWIGRTWNETPIKEGDNPNWKNATNIEYTRTDAFIEKACDWLINHNDYICGSTNGIVKYDMKQLVEDFKKYMED